MSAWLFQTYRSVFVILTATTPNLPLKIVAEKKEKKEEEEEDAPEEEEAFKKRK